MEASETLPQREQAEGQDESQRIHPEARVVLNDANSKEKGPLEPDFEKGSTGNDSNENVKEPASELAPELPSPYRRIFIFSALCLSIFVVALDMTIIATAIPEITDEFDSLDSIGWYGSAFLLTAAAFQSTWGKAFKFFPLKTTFMTTIVVFELGSLICGVAWNNTTLIVGRAIAGMGGSGIAIGCYTTIAFIASAKQRPAYLGILGATYGVASVAGPLIGGVFTDRISWRWCFYINLPLGGAVLGILFLFFHTPSAAMKLAEASLLEKLLQMDPFGTTLTMAAVVCFLLAMQWGGIKYAWNSAPIVGTLVGFGVLTITTVIVEWKLGNRAMFVTKLLGQRAIFSSLISSFFLSGSSFLLIYYLPIYFQAVDHTDAAQSGIDNLPLIVAASSCTLASGLLVTKFDQYLPFVLVGSAISTVGAGLIYTLDVGSPPAYWIGYQILAGAGSGLAVQIPMVVVQSVVQPSDISTASGMVLFMRTMGGAIFVSAGQSAFTNVLINEIPKNAPGIDVNQVIVTGATDLVKVFSSSAIFGIIHSYMVGLRAAYTIVILAAGIATLFALLMPWHSVKGLKKAKAV